MQYEGIGAQGRETRETAAQANKFQMDKENRRCCPLSGQFTEALMTATKTTTGKVYVTYVDQWLDTLPAADSEDFKEFAEVTPSVIEIWVYAGILKYPGTFNDLSRWVKMKFKKLNRREILNSEIAALHSDIQELRMAITSGEIKGSDGAARLAALEKELEHTLRRLTR